MTIRLLLHSLRFWHGMQYLQQQQMTEWQPQNIIFLEYNFSTFLAVCKWYSSTNRRGIAYLAPLAMGELPRHHVHGQFHFLSAPSFSFWWDVGGWINLPLLNYLAQAEVDVNLQEQGKKSSVDLLYEQSQLAQPLLTLNSYDGHRWDWVQQVIRKLTKVIQCLN